MNGDLDKAVRFVRAITRSAQVTVLGYCFGALLSLVYTALHPENVRNLVTATTPFDMGVRELPIYNIVERMTEETIDLVTRVHGNCPAWMVQSFFTAMAPAHHAMRQVRRDVPQRGARRLCGAVRSVRALDEQRRGDGGTDLPRNGGRHLQAQSAWRVANSRSADARSKSNKSDCPLLNVVADYDDVVHPRSSLGLVDRVSSRDRRN